MEKFIVVYFFVLIIASLVITVFFELIVFITTPIAPKPRKRLELMPLHQLGRNHGQTLLIPSTGEFQYQIVYYDLYTGMYVDSLNNLTNIS